MIFDNTPAAWTQDVKPDSIVAYRFPLLYAGEDVPKVRPTLVLDVIQQFNRTCAVVCYGTTNPLADAQRAAYTVDVYTQSEIAAASLHLPTRFHGSRRLLVSLDSVGFEVSDKHETAILGALTGGSHKRLQQIRARIHAEQDMARAHQHRRRARRQPTKPRAFIVEHRKSAPTREGASHG